MFTAEEIMIRFTDCFARVGKVQESRHREVDPDEAAFDVLEVDIIGCILEQRGKQITIV